MNDRCRKTMNGRTQPLPSCILDRKLSKKSGQIPKNWVKERVQNEASALQFIATQTTGSVPTVIEVGEEERATI